MGMIQLPDDLQSVVERQVAEGRADSPAAFLEEAVRRLVDEAANEENDLRAVVEAGSADIQAGRYTIVTTSDDQQGVHDAMMARLRARLSTSA